jgi:hypothetical protein
MVPGSFRITGNVRGLEMLFARRVQSNLLAQ